MEKLGFELQQDDLPERFKAFLQRCEEIRFVEKAPGVVINGLPFPFDFKFKRIGVNFSGGGDSTMLLFLLCTLIEKFNLETKIFPLCITRQWEKSKHIDRAKLEVLKYLKGRFPGPLQEPTWGFIPTALDFTPLENIHRDKEGPGFIPVPGVNADFHYFFMFNMWSAEKLELEAIYEGTTSNPPKGALAPEIKDAPKFRDQLQVQMQKHVWPPFPNRYNGLTVQMLNPFFFIEKNWVTAQYENFDIMDLLALTQSCELKPNGCGSCFHCKERQWALETKTVFVQKC